MAARTKNKVHKLVTEADGTLVFDLTDVEVDRTKRTEVLLDRKVYLHINRPVKKSGTGRQITDNGVYPVIELNLIITVKDEADLSFSIKPKGGDIIKFARAAVPLRNGDMVTLDRAGSKRVYFDLPDYTPPPKCKKLANHRGIKSRCIHDAGHAGPCH